MRRIIFMVIGSLMVMGCGHTVKVRVTSEADPAMANFKTLKGDPTDPQQCQTPCLVTIPKSTRCQMTVTAKGFYPATFEFGSDDAYATKQAIDTENDEVRLVVPMIKRPVMTKPQNEQSSTK